MGGGTIYIGKEKDIARYRQTKDCREELKGENFLGH